METCCIDDKAAYALARTFAQLSQLQSIQLQGNQMQFESVYRILVRTATLQHLTAISIAGNPCCEDDATCLQTALDLAERLPASSALRARVLYKRCENVCESP